MRINRYVGLVRGKLSSILAVTLLATLCLIPLATHAQSVNEAIVKVYAVYNQPDYYNPWQMHGSQARTGSGCIIEGNRILTDAHVVADQIFMQVQRAGEARKYMAAVEIVAHECDLAILEVSDGSFFLGVEPLQIGQLPTLRDRVVVYGFPQGGNELCITEGVVSRVEHQYYTHSQEYLLTCQIDAAINPGSSGGPVIKDGEIVGVAFQAGHGENIGYMVPAPVIERFLEDIEDGEYDGMPGIGIRWQKMENPDLRHRYGMTTEQTGILINKIYPGSPADGVLQLQDVILSIDNANIENDGTIEFRAGERTSFSYLIQSKFIGDTVGLSILCDKAVNDLEIIFTKPLGEFRLVPNEQYDTSPRYYIVGGLVFEPLTLNLLKIWGANWYGDAPRNLVNYCLRGEPTKDRSELVILVRVLADEVNIGYQNHRYEVITEVNGKSIRDMTDLIDAFEDNTDLHHVIINEREERIILDRAKVEGSAERILRKYSISTQ